MRSSSQDEIKAFVAFLSKYTYSTFRLNVLERISDLEDEAV